MSKRKRQHKDSFPGERRDLRDRARLRERRATEAGSDPHATDDDLAPATFSTEE